MKRQDDPTIPAGDGYPLAATLAAPTGDPRAVVLVAPATGVLRRIYSPFADFLREHGYAVATWDWRGIGASRPESLRGFTASMRHWATLDLAGVIRWAVHRFPDRPLLVVGHSFGGQGVGLAPNAGRIAGLVTVAAQSGYWGHWPAPRKYAYATLWYLVMPALTRTFGYFPSRRLGLGENLPRGVALQWARWCRNPGYMNTWDGHRRFTSPILAWSFADDAYAPKRAVEALLLQYGSEPIDHRHLSPGDAGATSIGHFGFFREGRTPRLWEETVEWMDEIAAAGS